MADHPTDQFWRVPLKALCDQVDGSAAGLTAIEADKRLARFGLNTVAPTPHRRLLLKIAKRFAEPLVAILMVAAAISGVTGDIASFCIIVVVIAVSIILDVVQEHRAEQAADALKRSVAIHADVRRDGKIISIPVEQVVPGDVVELRAGDLVPADGVVLDSRNAHVNEALMTGEPFPTEKRAGPCDATAPAEAFNALFAGTSVVSGEATMLVIATGGATRFGGIAAALVRRRAAERLRARHPSARTADPAADDIPRAVRAAGAPRVRTAGARILPVRRGARRRPDARTAADGDDRDAVARRDAHGRERWSSNGSRRSTTSAPWTCCAPTRPAR